MAEERMLNDEILLGLIKANSGGGGGGTTDYDDLNNKPQIGGVTLSGNKSASDLGLATTTDLAGKQDTLTFDDTPTQNSTNPVESNGVYDAIALKQDKTDNTLQTTSKTVVGAVNELKSGLTTLDNEVNGDATTYPYADVITIPDAVPANLADCTVKIEPVQNLHGQSAPYVGGAGKNKLPLTLDGIKAANTDGTWSGNKYTYNGITLSVQTDNDGNVIGIYTPAGTPSAVISFNLYNGSSFPFDIDNTYILNGCPSGGSSGSFKVDIVYRKSGADSVLCTDLGVGATADYSVLDGAVSINCRIVLYAVEQTAKTFLPMIRLATETDATFAPYTNICPITGHTEASVQMDGKNWFNINKSFTDAVVDHVTNDGYIVTKANAPVYWSQVGTFIAKKNVKYTLSVTDGFSGYCARIALGSLSSVSPSAGNIASLPETNLNVNEVTQIADSTHLSKTFISTEDQTIYLWICTDRNNTGSFASATFALQIEVGETATPYEPYAGKTYTIALGDTIYGGTVDFDSGVMTVTHKSVDMGDLSWNRYTGVPEKVFYYAILSDGAKTGNNNGLPVWCSCFKTSTESFMTIDDNTITAGSSFSSTDTSSAVIKNNNIADATELLGIITGQSLVYELATPFTVQLTPQQIQLLQGQNTLTASTGDISVTVNGVAGSIGSVQEQVNEIAEDVTDVQSGLAKLHYHKIAESAATGTRADKLASLYTTYNMLLNDVRKSAILLRNNADMFHAVNNGGTFSSVYLDASSLVFIGVSLNPGSFIVNSNGTTTDGSSTENTEVYSLWIIE